MSYKRKRITVKIGSNVLARPDGTLDITRMSALTDQIAKLHKAGVEIIVISSGAVASGRSELKIHRKLDAVSARQLFSAVGQAKLINRYYELFREHNIACGQVLTTKENFSTRRQYLTQKQCMEVMLENKVIPIVNENDTISVTELMFTDNDELSKPSSFSAISTVFTTGLRDKRAVKSYRKFTPVKNCRNTYSRGNPLSGGAVCLPNATSPVRWRTKV